ncbi:uncharacterized protein [Prorops nasuta]|uniref:uncharacterized protein n=1 Tax=Prorops nasuta TaxID=863751 RepID=UPI0034CE0F32
MEETTLPAKRLRISNNSANSVLKLQLTECIREFELPQQYPSMMKIEKGKSLLKPVMRGYQSSTSNNRDHIKFWQSKKVHLKNPRLQKLRIKGKDGRDLGEFNVKLLPCDGNVLKGKTITMLKQIKPNQMECKLNKNEDSPIAMDANVKLENRLPIIQHMSENHIPCDAIMLSTDKLNFNQEKLYGSIKTIKSLNAINDSKNGKLQKVTYKEKPKEIIACLNLKRNPIILKGNNKFKASASSSQTYVDKVNYHRNIQKSLVVTGLDNNLYETDMISKENETYEPKTEYVIVEDRWALNRNTNKKKNNNLNGTNDCFKKNQDHYLNKSNYTTLDQISDLDIAKSNFAGEVLMFQGRSETDMHNDLLPNAVQIEENEKDKDLTILEKAICNINNLQLRREALKILTDWSTNTKMSRSFVCKPNLNLINDTIKETEEFRRSETDTFVNLKSNEGKEGTRNNDNMPLNTRYKLKGQNLPLENHSSGLELLDSVFDVSPSDDVRKIKQVFNQASKICQIISKQLCKDFNSLKEWDDNGLLNIHKAVMNNHEADVRRYILILEAYNETVDILTKSGMTSLELAIQYSASDSIIKLLLSKGAQPVLLKAAHESALIIACKKKSHLIPELIKHVSNPALLNQMDATGFAPLHYCAQLGCINGLSCLIKAGANINLKDKRSGRTALFHALENKFLDAAQILKEFKARTDITNYAGQTVMCLVDNIKDLSFVTSWSIQK